MCVYECTEKPFDGWVETLVKHEVYRYLSTSEWINAASTVDICSNLDLNIPLKNVKILLTVNISHKKPAENYITLNIQTCT